MENVFLKDLHDIKCGDEVKEKSFACGINFYKLFFVFFIGCLLGVLVENLWCFAQNGYFESRRGLIYGPLNAVYGFGTVMLTVGLYKLQHKNTILLFLAGAFLGGAVEYVCSLFQELAFGTVSWDYAQNAFNLAGRTSPKYMLYWGLLGILWIRGVYPVMSYFIEQIPNKIGKILTYVLLVFMIFNMIISAVAVYRWSQRVDGIPADNGVTQFIDKHYPDARMKKVYPEMMFVKHNMKKAT